MSQIMDCPHCGMPQVELMLSHRIVAYYANLSHVHAEVARGIVYRISEPKVHLVPFEAEKIDGFVLICRECEKPFDLPEDWIVVTEPGGRSAIVHADRAMEEQL